MIEVSDKDNSGFSQQNKKDNVLHVAIGSDHGGYESKEMLKTYIQNLGYKIYDVLYCNKKIKEHTIK